MSKVESREKIQEWLREKFEEGYKECDPREAEIKKSLDLNAIFNKVSKDKKYSDELKFFVYDELIKYGFDMFSPHGSENFAPIIKLFNEGKHEYVKSVFEKSTTKANLLGKSDCEKKILSLSIFNNNLDMVSFFVESGCDLNFKGNNGWTPFMEAVSQGNTEMVKYMFENGAKLDRTNDDNEDPLTIAAGRGDVQMLKTLLELGAVIKNKDGNKKLPMMVAVIANDEEMVRTLIELGVGKVTDADIYGYSIMERANSKMRKVIKEAVEKRAEHSKENMEGELRAVNIDFANYITKENIERWEAHQLKTFEGLDKEVEKGVYSRETVNAYRQDFLGARFECWKNDDELSDKGKILAFDALIRLGFDMGSTELGQVSPLMSLALDKKNNNIVQHLVENGLDPNIKDYWLRTPVWAAAERNDVKMCEWLLNHGGDFNIKDINGYTPLMIAVSRGNIKMVEFLVEQGANVDEKDKFYKDVMKGDNKKMKEVIQQAIENRKAKQKNEINPKILKDIKDKCM